MTPTRRKLRALKKHTMPEISLTPLIDTALVLLVIFMVATPIMKHSLNIDLPKGNMKEDQATSVPTVVAIDAQQHIRLHDQQMTLDEVLTTLRKEMKDSKDGKVYIDCDQKVPSGTLVHIIDSIKYIAGVERVILSTERA